MNMQPEYPKAFVIRDWIDTLECQIAYGTNPAIIRNCKKHVARLKILLAQVDSANMFT